MNASSDRIGGFVRRGTPLSRGLAGLVASVPVLVVVGAIAFGAVSIWNGQSERYADEQYNLRRINAEAEQARLYQPLREAWRDYAQTDLSGLSQAGEPQAAESEMRLRLAGLFQRFGGVWETSEVLAAQLEPGIERLRVESRGRLPESVLTAFLESVETETPFLFIDLLDANRGADLNGEAALDIRLQVSSYRLAESDS
ncbi:MAG: GspMb/PilO family protein [Pseudomonadota bacterium]